MNSGTNHCIMYVFIGMRFCQQRGRQVLQFILCFGNCYAAYKSSMVKVDSYVCAETFIVCDNFGGACLVYAGQAIINSGCHIR